MAPGSGGWGEGSTPGVGGGSQGDLSEKKFCEGSTEGNRTDRRDGRNSYLDLDTKCRNPNITLDIGAPCAYYQIGKLSGEFIKQIRHSDKARVVYCM